MNSRRNFDSVLLIVIIALCAFGILMVFSRRIRCRICPC